MWPARKQRTGTSTLENFVHDPKYKSKYEDPFYKKLVRERAKTLRADDFRDSVQTGRRQLRHGSFNTGGKAGLAPIAPAFGDEEFGTANPDLVTPDALTLERKLPHEQGRNESR